MGVIAVLIGTIATTIVSIQPRQQVYSNITSYHSPITLRQDHAIAQLLIANNLHFGHNCAEACLRVLEDYFSTTDSFG